MTTATAELPAPVDIIVEASPHSVRLARRLIRATLESFGLDDDQVHAGEVAVRDLFAGFIRDVAIRMRVRIALAFAWPLLTAEVAPDGEVGVVEYIDVTGFLLSEPVSVG